MPITKFDTDHIWANDGDVTSPSDAKKDTGWVPGEQPSADIFNSLEQEVEIKINEIVTERINSQADSVVDPFAMIASGLFPNNFGNGLSDDMFIFGGATKKYVDMAVFFDATTNGPKLLVLDQSITSVEVWDARTLSSVAIFGSLTDDLPAGTWRADGICCDNDNFYVLFWDTALEVSRVQSWNVSSGSVNIGWPATGVATTTPAGFLPGVRSGMIIIADGSNLAVGNSINAVVTSASALVSIINKSTGTLVAEGAGDCSVGAQVLGIVSDGTVIYISGYGPGVAEIGTCLISSPSTGSGGTGYPLDPYSGVPSVVGAVGGMIISANTSPNAISDVVIRTHRAERASCDSLLLGQNSYSTPVNAKNYLYSQPYNMCSDGVSIYIATKPVGQLCAINILKIDSSKLFCSSAGSVTQVRQVCDVTNSKFLIGQDVPVSTGHAEYVPIVWDGRDIWVAPQPAASSAGSGYLFRLPLAMLRS